MNGTPAAGSGRRGQRLARALGWASVGLGVPQVVMPDRVLELVGVRRSNQSRAVMRAVGVRELTAAGAILSRPRSPVWLWSRVLGDAIDLTLLGAEIARADVRRRTKIAAAAAAVGGIAVLDVVAGRRLSEETDRTTPGGALVAKAATTINRPVEEVYRAWRDFESFPRFMFHVEEVRSAGEGRWHWVAKAPAGRTVEWDAEIVKDEPNALIAWRSLADADVANSGSVRFAGAPGHRGTEVAVELEYDPPAGSVGALVAKLFGEDPTQQLHDDLRRFKQILETGEVLRSDGSPEGSRTQRQFHQEDARPRA